MPTDRKENDTRTDPKLLSGVINREGYDRKTVIGNVEFGSCRKQHEDHGFMVKTWKDNTLAGIIRKSQGSGGSLPGGKLRSAQKQRLGK
jgi:hypothetical protein